MHTTNLKKNLFSNTIGMVLYNLAIWTFSVLILRVLGAQMSGYYAVATSIGNTLYAVALWGMRSFVVSDTQNKYSLSEYAAARLDAILIGFVILIVLSLVMHYDSTQIIILVLYSIFKFTEALIELIDCFFQRELAMEVNATSMVIRAISFTSIFALLLFLTHNLVYALVGIIVISLLVYFFYNRRMLKKHLTIWPLLFNQRVVAVLKHCLPIMIFELLAALIVAIPRLFYERIGDLGDLGIYVSIYTLVVFLQLAINVLIFTYAPYMAKAYNKHDTATFRKQFIILFGGATVLALLAELAVLLLGQPVIGLLFGSEAAPHYSYLYLGILSGVTLTFTWMLSQLFVIFRMTVNQLICSTISTSICFVLSMALINPSDCNSISWVLILTNLSFILSAAFILFRKRKDIAL